VGGGGGHKIFVGNFFCKIFPVTWNVKGTNTSHHMKDLEGDEGLYTGQCNASGKAHGVGELHYVDGDGDQFIGEFFNGLPVNGCQYQGKIPTATMIEQHWTYNVESDVVRRFPQNIIFYADFSYDSDSWSSGEFYDDSSSESNDNPDVYDGFSSESNDSLDTSSSE